MYNVNTDQRDTCVFPPELAWMVERERLPAAVKELKKAPTRFMAPYAINSCVCVCAYT